MAVNQSAVNEAVDAIVTTGSVADAMNTLTTKDANVLVSMSAAATISSVLPGAANNQPVMVRFGTINAALAAGGTAVEYGDGKFTWADIAATSALIGAGLERTQQPTFKWIGVGFSAYAILIPYLNAMGYSLGSRLYSEFNEVDPGTSTFFLQFKSWTPPRTDPLVLDLDNDGIETIGIGGTVVVFDHNADGIRTGTGWVKSDDGFLVLDRNDNGTIDSGRELFGVDTIKSNGALATNGFEALSELDANGDHVFDQNDAEFAHLQVWRDFNQNGISTANELFSLSELGIVSFNLNATTQNVNLGNGNVQTAAAAHLTVDGTGQTGNLDLANNPFYREFVDTIPLTEQALNLPDNRGSGWVRDLREAASLSPAVASVLTSYGEQINYVDQKALLDDLITAWANTSTMKNSVEQAADQGYFLIYLKPSQSWSEHDTHMGYWNTTDNAVLDALSPTTRAAYEALQQNQEELVGMINVLERFNGTQLVTVGTDRVTLGNNTQETVRSIPGVANSERVFVSLSTQQIEFMQQSYATLKESIYGSLVLQTRLAPYLNEVVLNTDESGQVFVSFSALNTRLEDQKIANPSAALADLIELNKYAGTVLQENGWTGLDMLRNWIDQGVGGVQTPFILQDLGISVIERGALPDDIVISSASNTNINGSGNNDILNGGVGNDTLYGNLGNDTLYGGSGRDFLMGGDGDDILRGGGGENDYLSGENGSDTYMYAIGDGNISINNSDTASTSNDVLRFMPGINPVDVVVRRDSNNLLLTIKDTGKVINVTNQFYEDNGGIYALDTIEFSNGTLWDNANIKQMVMRGTTGNDNIAGFGSDDTVDGLGGDDILSGAGGNDHLSGNIGNDSLTGGEGNDTLLGGDGQDSLYGSVGNDVLNGGLGANDYMEGGEGNDIYLFAVGDGNTTINNQDANTTRYDVLRFASGINPSNVSVGHSGYYDLKLTLQSTGEVITVKNHFAKGGMFLLNAVEFADGTIWSSGDLKSKVLTGTAGADTITGFFEDDTISGLGGNDTLDGSLGNDTLIGGDGQDYLFGDSGDDILNGGLGVDDVMNGGSGNDVYLFAAGDGNTTIHNDNYQIGAHDVLRFASGISSSDLLVRRSGYDLNLTLQSTGEVIRVSLHYLSDENSLYAIEFADGTTWNNDLIELKRLQGSTGNDNITGYASDDIIDGLSGDDTLSGAGGNDYLNGNIGNDTLNGGDGNDTLLGGDGQDSLYGNAGNDILNGGLGVNAFMAGGEGSDIYILAAGAGNTTINNYDTSAGRYDVLRFASGISPSNVQAKRSGDDLLIILQNTGEVITVESHFYNEFSSLNAIEFIDGTIWNNALINQLAMQGTTGNDRITGFASNDIIDGLGGDDVLSGVGGNDNLIGNAGNDSLFGGEGNDTLLGGDGQDELYGNAGNDTLNGGQGTDDYMSGDEGNDIYLFAAGDGNIRISNYDINVGRYDVLRFTSGISPGNVLVGHLGDNLLLTIQSTGEVITVERHFSGADYTLNAVEFADGTIWNSELIKQKATGASMGDDNITGFSTSDILDGLSGNDIISGLEGNDQLNGNIGNDILKGGGGNDTLLGGDGQDSLFGDAGNDILNGGLGVDDYMSGDEGNDIYLFAAGDGNTTINNYDISIGRYDVLRFAPGINPSQVLAQRSVDSLRLMLQSTGETITVQDHFRINFIYPDQYILNAVEFADGTIWNSTLINQLVMQGTTGNDTLIGSSSDDTVDGLSGDDFLSGDRGNDYLSGNNGNDVLYGGYGNDSLLGGDGQDSLYGDDGADILNAGLGANDYMEGGGDNDIYLFAAGDGNTTINNYDTSTGHNDILRFASGIYPTDVLVRRSSNDLQLTLQSNGELITVQNHFLNGNQYLLNAVEFADGTIWNSATLTEKLLTGTAGADTITGFATNDTINGLGGNDTLNGGGGNDTLYGGDGDDSLNGGTDTDLLLGELGNDIYTVDNVGDNVIESINAGIDKINSSVTYTISANVENLTLTGTLAINGTGNDLNNTITGNSAANQLSGGVGDDTLDGRLGNDILTGGTGKDSFNLTTSGNIDTIKDFVAVDDTIRLENAVFTKLTATGTLAASRFRIGNQAMDADDYIIYNNTTGALYYDSNGNGTGAAVQIATIGVGLSITNTDFVVI